ncbi:aconitase X catalytic domain-containing protein [Candidatus Formimonas warabiya]|uniref:aconitase X catalytic domain-containing protein n=1 Tax=Formimonas warabiya TaxID=1761012 RepID=UPI003AB08AD0
MGFLYLTDEEKAMLAGEYGAGTALAMKIQVAVGECFDAPRMVEISKAHVALSNQEADLWFVEKLLKAGARCRIAPTVNPGFHLEFCREHLSISTEDGELMERTRKAYQEIGAILTFSCTPYLEANVPRFGEIISYSETSATAYVNSVIGARTNRESVQSSLCAAITGRVPEYGYLLEENRTGNILVQVEADIKNDFDYQLLGYCAKKIGYGVPVFVGLPAHPSQEALMNLGAQLNTIGAYAIYHVVGVTPEAQTIEDAFGGKDPARTVVITNEDLAEVHQNISHPEGKIAFAMFGCPHFTINQVREIAQMVHGKKLAAEMWILTSSLTKELADRMGLTETIENSGGHILDNTCIDQPCWHHLEGKVGVTDSPKCAYYTKRRGLEFIIRDLRSCVDAALKGEVS